MKNFFCARFEQLLSPCLLLLLGLLLLLAGFIGLSTAVAQSAGPAEGSAATAGSPAAKGSLVVLGDSLSAGYGIRAEQGWVTLLERRLDALGYEVTVVNASISGDTTHGGLTRLPKLLARFERGILVLELGGNDGLRGLSLSDTRANLNAIIEQAQAGGFAVLLVGIKLPPNLGPVFNRAFQNIYPDLAAKHELPLVPFLLEGVALEPALMQSDGIHPKAEAQERLLDNVWPYLKPLL
ncbi:MAG: arylesterase [Gammaproteobacteria bacterium]|nr:arylesterase [Gammaproteobacteria bacterium]